MYETWEELEKEIGVDVSTESSNKTIIKVENTLEALYEIAKISDGGMRDSLSSLDKLISYSDKKITVDDFAELNGMITKIPTATASFNTMLQSAMSLTGNLMSLKAGL